MIPEKIYNQDLATELMFEMVLSLRYAVVKAAETDEWKRSDPVALTRAVKQSFDKTCGEWEERLDARLHQKYPAGTFRHECTLFRAPLDAFGDCLATDFNGVFVNVVRQENIFDCLVWDATRMDKAFARDFLCATFELAARSTMNGADDCNKICWECGVKSAMTQVCTGCDVARYCRRGCQVKAWKAHHKIGCPLLKTEHHRFGESLLAVDNANRTGVLAGVRLDMYVDYWLLGLLHTVESVYMSESFGVQLGQRSMQYFYENLGRVIRGEWWLVSRSESDTRSTAEFKQKQVSQTQPGCSHEMDWKIMALLISYDYSGYAARIGVNGPKNVTRFFEAAVTEHADSSGYLVLTPGLFLKQISAAIGKLRSESQRIKLRKDAKSDYLVNVRRCFHTALLLSDP